MRVREYLTPAEIELLLQTAKDKRNGHRDMCMMLLAYRHGLRPGELVTLQWQQFDFKQGTVHVNRQKNGLPSVHPLGGAELRALRKLKREMPENRYLFISERGAPISTDGFARMVERAGERAKFPFKVHPHMFRHACGYKLSNEGKDAHAIQLYMGHKYIQNTVIYTQLSAARFKDFWSD